MLNNGGHDDVTAALPIGANTGISAHQLEARASVGHRPHIEQQGKSFIFCLIVTPLTVFLYTPLFCPLFSYTILYHGGLWVERAIFEKGWILEIIIEL